MKTVILTQESIHKGNLILVNTWYPYQDNIIESSLVPVNDENSNVSLDRHVVTLLSKIMDELNGWKKITPISGWRSRQEQQEIYTKSLQDSGRTFTEKFVARPGCSEHQTGFAIDLALKQKTIDFICPDFPYMGICQSFRQKSISFGFIERYPQDKESITGIGHEPWHFRYVGTPHAEIMKSQGFVLEEYINFLKQYRYGENSHFYNKAHMSLVISYLKASKTTDTRFEIDSSVPYSISGNNIDGFIITEWKEQNERH